MNEFDQMFEEIKKRMPQVAPEQFSQACRTVIAAAKPEGQLSMYEVSKRVEQELGQMMAK